MPNVKKQLRKAIEKHGREWSEIQPAWLGDLAGTVVSGTAGVYFARLANGKVIRVHNTFGAPPTFDLHVKIGRTRNLSKIWQIIQVMEDYDTPAAGGEIAYHHEQHMFGHGDELQVNRKQITAWTVRVYDGANFIVTLLGDVLQTPTGLVLVSHQNVDLSAEAPATGAVFVSIEVDYSGAISLNTGANFGSPFVANVSYVAEPDPGKTLIAYVLMYEGQAELLDEHIHVPMPLGVLPLSSGSQIADAAADTPLDADLFGFWDMVDEVLKKITWANIKATLKTYFDTVYSALGHTHTLDASTVTYTPADASDWDGGTDPGDTNDALDQLAARMVVAESGIGQYRQMVYEVGGGDINFLTDDDGYPLFNLEDLE